MPRHDPTDNLTFRFSRAQRVELEKILDGSGLTISDLCRGYLAAIVAAEHDLAQKDFEARVRTTVERVRAAKQQRKRVRR